MVTKKTKDKFKLILLVGVIITIFGAYSLKSRELSKQNNISDGYIFRFLKYVIC
jgi:hypothetical protein